MGQEGGIWENISKHHCQRPHFQIKMNLKTFAAAAGLRPDPLGLRAQALPRSKKQKRRGQSRGRWENIFKTSLLDTSFFGLK